MAVDTSDCFKLIAVGMAAYATIIGRAGSCCVVMTDRTIFTQLGMHVVIELNGLEQVDHSVKRHLFRHISSHGCTSHHYEGQYHHQGG
jgi:hypothetical protein